MAALRGGPVLEFTNHEIFIPSTYQVPLRFDNRCCDVQKCDFKSIPLKSQTSYKPTFLSDPGASKKVHFNKQTSTNMWFWGFWVSLAPHLIGEYIIPGPLAPQYWMVVNMFQTHIIDPSFTCVSVDLTWFIDINSRQEPCLGDVAQTEGAAKWLVGSWVVMLWLVVVRIFGVDVVVAVPLHL